MQTTMTKKQRDDEIATQWARFQRLSLDAEIETKRQGAPDVLTQAGLDRLNAALDRLEGWVAQEQHPGALQQVVQPGRVTLNGVEYEYERGTAAHATFVKALRYGRGRLAEWERERVRLVEPDESKAMTRLDETTGGYLASEEFSSDLLALQVDASARYARWCGWCRPAPPASCSQSQWQPGGAARHRDERAQRHGRPDLRRACVHAQRTAGCRVGQPRGSRRCAL